MNGWVEDGMVWDRDGDLWSMDTWEWEGCVQFG